MSSYDKRNKN